MRSITKAGVALAALVLAASMLAGCATSSSAANESVDCSDVSAQITSAQATLESANEAVKANEGTLGAETAKSDKEAATATLSALKQRAISCEENTEQVPSLAQSEEACAWQMTTADHTSNRWFYEGIAEIRSATNVEEAVTASGVWLDKVREVPTLLSGAARVFLGKDVDKATLVDADNCASDTAVDLYSEIALTLAGAQSIVPEEVPNTANNSGVVNDTVVFDAEGGVYGDDRQAVKVVTADGKVIWIMARCGNLATPSNPGLPTGPTDNVLYPKNINDAPQRTGNLPEQQMPNPLPALPEHYQPVQPATPPATYTPPPAAPAPQPAPVPGPTGTIPAPAPEPTPVQTTAPIPPATTPSDPGTSTSCAPGRPSC